MVKVPRLWFLPCGFNVLLTNFSLTLCSFWLASRCLMVEKSYQNLFMLWCLFRFLSWWKLYFLNRKNFCFRSAMLSLKAFIFGDAGQLVCLCATGVFELRSVMVMNVMLGLSSDWPFPSGPF